MQLNKHFLLVSLLDERHQNEMFRIWPMYTHNGVKYSVIDTVKVMFVIFIIGNFFKIV